jgi:hypothetical protein
MTANPGVIAPPEPLQPYWANTPAEDSCTPSVEDEPPCATVP